MFHESAFGSGGGGGCCQAGKPDTRAGLRDSSIAFTTPYVRHAIARQNNPTNSEMKKPNPTNLSSRYAPQYHAKKYLLKNSFEKVNVLRRMSCGSLTTIGVDGAPKRV